MRVWVILAFTAGALAAAGLGVVGCHSHASSTTVSLDVGQADDMSLHDAWLAIGDAAGFDARNAKVYGLELDYTPAGSLLGLLIVARADGDKHITVDWRGEGAQTGQTVTATASVVAPGPRALATTSDPAYEMLAAIDEVGPRTLIAGLMPADATGALASDGLFLRVKRADMGTIAGNILPEANAYLWNGSAFEPLPPTDERRKVGDDFVRLSLLGLQIMPTHIGQQTALATQFLVYFVVPVSSD